jgi:uncharacterized protein (TIGR02284 family)
MAEIVNTINDLIATCRDSEEGFSKAAKGVHSDHLRSRFTGIARQRADFADELAEQLSAMGGEPAVSGHQSGIQHRSWRELETSIRPKDDASFLRECEVGEENTLRHYDHAESQELPAEARSAVQRHRLAIEQTLLELKNLEHAPRPG